MAALARPTAHTLVMKPKEMDSNTGLTLAGPKQLFRLFGRALLLRCPNCGNPHVLKHWLKLRDRCDRCGLRLERGEHDYFTGSMLVNFTLSGAIFFTALAVIMIRSAPNIPWDTLQFVMPLLMIVTPILLFPVSKLLWLAFDLALRPATQEELDWHRASEEQFSSEKAPRK